MYLERQTRIIVFIEKKILNSLVRPMNEYLDSPKEDVTMNRYALLKT